MSNIPCFKICCSFYSNTVWNPIIEDLTPAFVNTVFNENFSKLSYNQVDLIYGELLFFFDKYGDISLGMAKLSENFTFTDMDMYL